MFKQIMLICAFFIVIPIFSAEQAKINHLISAEQAFYKKMVQVRFDFENYLKCLNVREKIEVEAWIQLKLQYIFWMRTNKKVDFNTYKINPCQNIERTMSKKALNTVKAIESLGIKFYEQASSTSIPNMLLTPKGIHENCFHHFHIFYIDMHVSARNFRTAFVNLNSDKTIENQNQLPSRM